MKGVILLEVLILFGGTLLIRHQRGETLFLQAGEKAGYPIVFVNPTTVKSAIACLILLAILLTMAEAGYGSVALAFGGLIALAYAIRQGAALGEALTSATAWLKPG